MLTEQNECEKQKKLSQEASDALVKKQGEIEKRKKIVDEDLGKAEPALIAAQESVGGITRKDLQELQSYRDGPAKVKLALEPVISLITKKPKQFAWADIKTELKDNAFISKVVNFDRDDIPPKVKDFIKLNYLKDEASFDTEAISRASKAAGPLALWVKSIIVYSEIYHSIEPLRAELDELEVQ